MAQEFGFGHAIDQSGMTPRLANSARFFPLQSNFLEASSINRQHLVMLTKSILLVMAIITSNVAGATESLPQSVARATSSPDGEKIVQDGKVEVFYRLDGPAIQFFSDLPADWSFSVAVDADQNGSWGSGPGEPQADPKQNSDFMIAQDSKNGIFCGQYILSASTSDPDRTYMSSDCDVFATGGSVTMSQMSPKKSATITYQMPIERFFGKQNSARIQVCIWDTQRSTCYFSPVKPFVIRRPTAAN